MPAGLAVQLYTLRDAVATDGLDAVLGRVASAGYAGVESAGLGERSPREYAAMLAAHDLTLASAHVGLAEDRDQYRAALDAHAEAGARTVVIPALGLDGFADLDAVRRSADIASWAHGEAAARGLALGYHNHFWEIPEIDGVPALVHFFASTDPAVLAEVDVYWAKVGGADPASLVAALGERVRLLHVKDGPADTPASAMTAVGLGTVDIAATLAAAPGAAWHIVELDRCDTDMDAAVAASARYLLDAGLSQGRS